MKTKFLWDASLYNLNDKINLFIIDKKVVDIKLHSIGNGDPFIVLVMYEDVENRNLGEFTK
jgi:hypothetical protein